MNVSKLLLAGALALGFAPANAEPITANCFLVNTDGDEEFRGIKLNLIIDLEKKVLVGSEGMVPFSHETEDLIFVSKISEDSVSMMVLSKIDGRMWHSYFTEGDGFKNIEWSCHRPLFDMPHSDTENVSTEESGARMPTAESLLPPQSLLPPSE
jgi:hypothetical protein